MGGIWAIAGGLAARLVPENAISLATSIIFGGVAAASVLGVPIGTFIALTGTLWLACGLAVAALISAVIAGITQARP